VPGLVSCILVTCNRRTFLQQALTNFSLQNYSDRELIVVDDSDIPMGDLCDGIPNVKYIRLETRTPTGTKLNIGIEAAQGDILQKLDDDDYYGPDFLSLASDRLRQSENPRALVAWCCFPVLIAGEGELFYSGHGWKAGGTFCFRRELWQQNRFQDRVRGSDSWFIRDNQPELLRVCAPDQYVLVRHGANTWHRIGTASGTCSVEEYFRERKLYPKSVEELTGKQSATFYCSLMRTGGSIRDC
jgi:O-antigen biosynthesis protein